MATLAGMIAIVVTGTGAQPTRSGAGSVGLAAFDLTQALPGGGVAGLLACGALLGAFTLARRTGLYEWAQRPVLGQVERLVARRTDAGGERLLHMAPTTSAQLLRGRALLGPLGWSISRWALDLAVLTLVVRAVGGTASLAATAGAYAAVNLLTSVPLTPGGLGVVEGGLSASLLAAGVLDLGAAESGELGILGAAGVVHLLLAGALWRWPRRRVLVPTVLLQLLLGAMYVAISPARDPSYEVWGLLIRGLSLVLVVLAILALVHGAGQRRSGGDPRNVV